MKNIKNAVIAVIGAIPLILPLGSAVHALQSVSICDSVEKALCSQELPTENLSCSHDPDSHGTCDLGVDKQVRINGGVYAEADSSADAAQAHVGDTVTWRITVSNTGSEGFDPSGNITVNDVLPSGAAFDSYVASTGTYDGTNWTFSLTDNLPATLTITSHATSTGLFKNTAVLSLYDPCAGDGNCMGVYADDNPDNNSNDAWFDPSAPPAVLAASTSLTNTGSGTDVSIAAVGLIAATLAVGAAGRFAKKQN